MSCYAGLASRLKLVRAFNSRITSREDKVSNIVEAKRWGYI